MSNSTAAEVQDRGFQPAMRANALIEALPYIEQFRGAVVVVKFGGNAMVDPDLSRTFAEDIVLLRSAGDHKLASCSAGWARKASSATGCA